jgi:hypothetical protein
MCFPSNASMQWGKFHLYWNYCAIFFHSWDDFSFKYNGISTSHNAVHTCLCTGRLYDPFDKSKLMIALIPLAINTFKQILVVSHSVYFIFYTHCNVTDSFISNVILSLRICFCFNLGLSNSSKLVNSGTVILV